MHCLHSVWLNLYVPAGHAVHDVLPPSTMNPSPQSSQVVTTPVAEYVPSSQSLFVVAPPTAGHFDPLGHSEHVALVATPSAS